MVDTLVYAFFIYLQVTNRIETLDMKKTLRDSLIASRPAVLWWHPETNACSNTNTPHNNKFQRHPPNMFHFLLYSNAINAVSRPASPEPCLDIMNFAGNSLLLQNTNRP